jgi:hypothetical protein
MLKTALIVAAIAERLVGRYATAAEGNQRPSTQTAGVPLPAADAKLAFD